MANQDFLRQLPEASHFLRRRNSIWKTLHIDPILLVLLLSLTLSSFIILYSASEANVTILKRQIIFTIIGYTAMLMAAQVKMDYLLRWALVFYIGAFILLVAVHFFGVGAKGAQRWLSFFGFRFQPSEMMKLAMPIAVSAYLSSKTLPPRFKHIAWSLVLVVAPALFIVIQPDLGTSILVSASGLIVLFLAGIRYAYIISAGIIFLLSAWPMWQFVLEDYQRQRILTLFNPEVDKLGAGWNITQSKTAIGSGGLYGKGWLEGTQSHLDFLPESHTDFIIAVLAEEFGFVGVLALIVLYLLIIARGLIIALYSQDSFRRLLAGSISFTFFVYAFVNIGMVSGLLPVVGVPLPLVSLGGTSLVTLLLGFGILMAISTEPRKLSAN